MKENESDMRNFIVIQRFSTSDNDRLLPDIKSILYPNLIPEQKS